MNETVAIIFFCFAIGFAVFTVDKILALGEPAVSYYLDGVTTTITLFAATFNLNKHL